MTPDQALKLLLIVSIFLNVFALALRARAADVLFLFREWRLGLRAFVAMFLVVPAVAVAIALLFELKPAVEVALIALALAPVPPLLPRKQIKAGGTASYVTGLLVGASLASVVVAPVGLHLIGRVFGAEAAIAPAKIAITLGLTIGAPLALGLFVARLLGDRAGGVANVVAKLAGILLLLGVLALLVVLAPAIWEVIGDGTLLALLALIVAGLVAGYYLAGRVPGHRTALSLAAAARHPGVALAIVAVNFPEAKLAAAAIVLAALLNAVVSLPLLRVMARSEGAQ